MNHLPTLPPRQAQHSSLPKGRSVEGVLIAAIQRLVKSVLDLLHQGRHEPRRIRGRVRKLAIVLAVLVILLVLVIFLVLVILLVLAIITVLYIIVAVVRLDNAIVIDSIILGGLRPRGAVAVIDDIRLIIGFPVVEIGQIAKPQRVEERVHEITVFAVRDHSLWGTVSQL